jgi:hypothetical protein
MIWGWGGEDQKFLISFLAFFVGNETIQNVMNTHHSISLSSFSIPVSFFRIVLPLLYGKPTNYDHIGLLNNKIILCISFITACSYLCAATQPWRLPSFSAANHLLSMSRNNKLECATIQETFLHNSTNRALRDTGVCYSCGLCLQAFCLAGTILCRNLLKRNLRCFRRWRFKSRSSWVVTPCAVAAGYQRFSLKMETPSAPKRWRHKPEDLDLPKPVGESREKITQLYEKQWPLTRDLCTRFVCSSHHATERSLVY